MSLYNIASKREQIIRILRDNIMSGKIPHQACLKSVRELSSEFAVSTKTIIHAFEALEEECLIIRKHGSGVYANHPGILNRREIAIFGYRLNSSYDNYFHHLAQIVQIPRFQDKYSFFLRSISKSPEATRELLNLEIIKMIKHQKIDCLLINAPSLTHAEIQDCSKLPVPVVFIGDFMIYPPDEMRVNQITGDNAEWGRAAVEQLAESGEQEFVVYTGSQEHYFNRKTMEGISQFQKQHNLSVHVVEFPKGYSAMPEARRNLLMEERYHKIKEYGWDKLASLNFGIPSVFFEKGHLQKVFEPKATLKSSAEFYKLIETRIDAVIRNSGDIQQCVFKWELQLSEMKNF